MGAQVGISYKAVALGAALCCSAMFAGAAAASAHGAPHGFVGVPSHAFKGEGQMHHAMHHHQFPQSQFGGDGMPIYLSGSFPAEPYGDEDDAGGGPYAYPFPYPPPYAMRVAMPPPCVTPLVIELGAAHHQAKLPKVTYGSSPGACPPPIVEAKH